MKNWWKCIFIKYYKGVKYSSVDLNGNEYIVYSTGEIDFKNTDIIFLQDVKALITLKMMIRCYPLIWKYNITNFDTIFLKM